jgi:hypothetical protein
MHRDTEFDAPGGARVRCSSTAFTEMLRMDAISRFVSVCLSRIGITRCSQIDRTDAARRGDHRDHAIVEPVTADLNSSATVHFPSRLTANAACRPGR